jgi:hypothetical protein
VLAGDGADTITTGAGSDTVFGDNGQIVYAGAVISWMQTTDTVALTGGDDVIDAGDGNNLVFGGVGSDIIATGSGADIVFGDNGTIVNDAAGSVVLAITGDPLLGGNDTIATGDGSDVAFGGAMADVVTSAGGNDVLFGDGGRVDFAAGPQLVIMSVDVLYGGNDTLNGGTGNDILIGGQGSDLLFGNLSEDLLFGSAAAVSLLRGLAQSIETDLHDLVSSALFRSFNALPGSGEGEPEFAAWLTNVPGYVTDVTRSLGAVLRLDPLLDVAVFRKLFSLTVVSQSEQLGTVIAFQNQFVSGVVTLPPAPAHTGVQEPGDGGDSTGRVSAQDLAGETLAALTGDRTAVSGSDNPGGDALVAALGAAGMLAVHQPGSRRRRILDWEAMKGAAGALLPLTRKALNFIGRV